MRAGPTAPIQDSNSKPGRPASASVGSFGNSGVRVAEVMPSERILPSCKKPRDAATSTIMPVTRPAITSVMAGGVER